MRLSSLLFAVAFLLPPCAAAQDNYTLTLPESAPAGPDSGAGTVRYIGTATVLIRYQGLTILTDPNFVPRGERIHLGYGATAERLLDPAAPLEALPAPDLVILSHLHEDHFDRLVQEALRHDVPIVTTPEAAERLGQLGFTQRYGLSPWDSLTVRKGAARLRITAMPARHGPRGVAVLLPPVIGTMLDFEESAAGAAYRIYISGDTLVVDGIAQVAQRFPDIDLALLHLGGMRVYGVRLSMDGQEGLRMMRMLDPQRVIPLHYEDYDVYRSPLSEFTQAVEGAGMQDRLIYLRRGQTYGFARASQ